MTTISTSRSGGSGSESDGARAADAPAASGPLAASGSLDSADAFGARERMRWFVTFWAMAMAFHHTDSHPREIVGILVASLPVLAWPTSTPLVGAFLALCVAIAAGALPEAANHMVLIMFTGLGFGVAALVAAGRPGAHSRDGGPFVRRWFEAARTSAGLSLLVVYGFTVFHKLNTAFFDPRDSCAGRLLRQALALNGVEPGLAGPGVVVPAAVGTVVVEAAILVLLAVPRLRRWGLLLGVGFHSVLALASFYDFATTVFALYLLLVPTRVFAAIAPAAMGSGVPVEAGGTPAAPHTRFVRRTRAAVGVRRTKRVCGPGSSGPATGSAGRPGLLGWVGARVRVGPRAWVGARVRVGPRAWVGVRVRVGPRAWVGARVRVGLPVWVGLRGWALIAFAVHVTVSLAGDSGGPGTALPVHWHTVRVLTWYLAVLPFMIALVRASFADQRLPREWPRWRAHPALLLVPLLAFANGAAPYLGLKTVASYSMFSNLHTEAGHTNHLLSGVNSLQVLPYERDVVTVVDVQGPPDTDVRAGVWMRERPPQVVPWLELRRVVALWRQVGLGPVALEYVRDGVPHIVDDARSDPELSAPMPWWQRKLLAFRAVDSGSGTDRCRW